MRDGGCCIGPDVRGDAPRPLPLVREPRLHDAGRDACHPDPDGETSAGRRAAAALARVAHDLRGPLTAIELATDGLFRAAEHDRACEAERMDVEIIRDAARWMQRMVGDLLDEAALASGRVTVRRAAVAPQTLVADAVRLLDGRAHARAVRLATEVPAGLPPVAADRDRVLQVLANLIENAIAHSAAGATVDVTVTPAADAVAFAVRDSGPGIPPEDLRHVFEPFWRAPHDAPHDARRGTGLGLAIARGIVEAHGGTIEVRSAPGRGTAFVFTVPSASDARRSDADTSRRM